jgi:hypothetical protein
MAYRFTQLFIPFVLLLLFLIYFKNKGTEVTTVKSDVDHRQYLVQNKKDKKEAANLLASVRIKLVEFVDKLKVKHPKDERVIRLAQTFQPDKISEGNEDSNYTTYTLNKGEKIVFCLRTRDQQDDLHELNLIVFVSVHELAHVCCLSQGHTEEFQEIFKFLIEEAVELGIYQPEDFRSNPVNYCGLDITDTPLGNERFK